MLSTSSVLHIVREVPLFGSLVVVGSVVVLVVVGSVVLELVVLEVVVDTTFSKWSYISSWCSVAHSTFFSA